MMNPKINRMITFLFVALLFISCGVFLVSKRQNQEPKLDPDYPSRETEKNQLHLEDDEGDKLDHSSGGGAINVTYSENVTVDQSNHSVELFYANPQVSNQNVAIMIRIDDLLVARSGLITPGHGIETLDLEPGAGDRLQVGGYDGEIVISVYHPETGEKVMVDIVGKITVTVQE